MKESRERGRAAVVFWTVAVGLLASTWFYVHSQSAAGRHAHISIHLVVADVVAPLLALWTTWDWFRNRWVPKDSRDPGKGRRSKKRNTRRSAKETSR